MSYIPSIARRSGYRISLPPGSTGPQPSALDAARQVFLTELTALAAINPADAEAEAESIASAARQLLHMAAANQASAVG